MKENIILKQARTVSAICIVTVATLIALPETVPATILMCSSPLKPICVDIDTTYKNEVQMKRCESDMSNYMKKVEEYASCMKEKAKKYIEMAQKTEKEFKKRLRQHDQP